MVVERPRSRRPGLKGRAAPGGERAPRSRRSGRPSPAARPPRRSPQRLDSETGGGGGGDPWDPALGLRFGSGPYRPASHKTRRWRLQACGRRRMWAGGLWEPSPRSTPAAPGVPPPGRAELDRAAEAPFVTPAPGTCAFASSPSIPLFAMSNPGRPGKSWGWSNWGPRDPRRGSSGRLPHPWVGMRIAATLAVEASVLPDAATTSSPSSSASPAPAAAWLRRSLTAPANCHPLRPVCQPRGAGRGCTHAGGSAASLVHGRPAVPGPARELEIRCQRSKKKN